MTATEPHAVPKGFLAILGFSFAVEGALYSAVTPILPLLSRTFGLSEWIAGLLLSGYSAGLVAGSLVCVLMVKRLNARDVAAGATAALAVATFLFAWADTSEVLLWARLAQGIAAGIAWTACISWLLSVWPVERRGEAMGSAMSPAVIGTVAGPSIGTLALRSGVQVPYTVVALACLAVALLLLRMPKPVTRRPSVDALLESRRDARSIAILGSVIAGLAGAVIGLVNLSGPLVLVDLGASDYLSGLAFLVAAAVTIFAARPMGVVVDRLGAHRTTKVGLLGLAVLLPVLGAGVSTYLVALIVVALVVTNNFCYISAATMLTRAGQESGWSLSFATALTATVWGLGETAGALLAGVGLDVVGSMWTTSISAGAVVVGLAVVIVTIRSGDGQRTSALESTTRP